MTMIDELFTKLFDATLREMRAPEIQRTEMRKAFFSGAWEMCQAMIAAAVGRPPDEAEHLLLKLANEIKEELIAMGGKFEGDD